MVLYGCRLCPNDPNANKFDRLLKKGSVPGNWRSSLEYHVQEVNPSIKDWQTLQVKVKVGKASKARSDPGDVNDKIQEPEVVDDTIVVNTTETPDNAPSDDNALDNRPRKKVKRTNDENNDEVQYFEDGVVEGHTNSIGTPSRAVTAKPSVAKESFMSTNQTRPRATDLSRPTIPKETHLQLTGGLPAVRTAFEEFDVEAWHGRLGKDLQVLARNAWPINGDIPTWSHEKADEASKHMLRYHQAKCEYFEHCLTTANDHNKELEKDMEELKNTIAPQSAHSEDMHQAYVKYVRGDLQQSFGDLASDSDLAEHLQMRGVPDEAIGDMLAEVFPSNQDAAEVENSKRATTAQENFTVENADIARNANDLTGGQEIEGREWDYLTTNSGRQV